jgi:hypothetical protein
VTSWKLPLIVAAIVVPVVAGFYVAGGAAGMGVGGLVAVAVVAVAARQRPGGAIGEPPSDDAGMRLLLVVLSPVEDPPAIGRIAAAADAGGDRAEVMVLAPARVGFLDRWASDVEGSRREAQRNLVLTVAALAKAGVQAEGRVGDEDVVQAVEDQLRSFAASEVILVGAEEEDERVDAAAAELRSRLLPPFHSLRVSGQAAR